MSVICFSSKATGLLAAWRNPYGKEEEQLYRAFFQLRASPLKQLIKTGVAQAGFSLLALSASVEAVAYAGLIALSSPLYLSSSRPRVCLELLKSSFFTIFWASFEIYRGCYMLVKDQPLINAPTQESFARMQLESLDPTSVYSFRKQDRAEVIKQILPSSSKRFIDFCIREDIWYHLKRNILSLNHTLSILCQDLENSNALDELKELYITNICSVSSDVVSKHWQEDHIDPLSSYFINIKTLKKVHPSLLQLHLQNVEKICASCPGLLESYFEVIGNIYVMTFPVSLENRADLGWINRVLQEVNILPFNLDQYLIDLRNETAVSIILNQTEEKKLAAACLALPLNLWIS